MFTFERLVRIVNELAMDYHIVSYGSGMSFGSYGHPIDRVMKNKEENKYKLPKIHVVGPIITYTLLFLMAIGVIWYIVLLFGRYAISVRTESEKDNTVYWADLYANASDDSKEDILQKLSRQGRSYCITDADGNIITSSGDITCVGYSESAGTINLKTNPLGGSVMVAFEDDEYPEESVVINDPFYSEGYIFLDKGNEFLYIAEGDLNLDIFRLLRSKNAFDDLFLKKNSINIPFWTGTDIGDTGEILIISCSATMNYKDFSSIFLAVAFSLAIALLLFIILISNIIGNFSASRKLKKLMFRDNITTNRNWFWFAIKSKAILENFSNRTKTFAVVELVFIKYRNFVLCHSVREGNDILREVDSQIRKSISRRELCAHSSSNGFPMLLEVKDEEDARSRLQALISSLEKISSNHKLAFRAGVYVIKPESILVRGKYGKLTADIDQLYNNASAAGASISGSDESGIAFFDDKLVDQEKWADYVQERQRPALENEEFLVYYQPKYDPRNDEIRGAEALVRWQTEDMGLVPPGKFIPIFENNGFITEIDHYMLRHVARDQKRWLDEGRKCVPVSVNVSRAHFIEDDLADQIRAIVDEEGAPHELIEIELTESAFFDDQKAMLKTIGDLKSYGFAVSMDDFGSGYSSLNSLKDMPLDILKLDAGFFRGSEDDERSKKVVSEAIKLAKCLDMKTVAEGVEEKGQVDFLASEGCDMIQGYYYAKPMPKEEYEMRI